MLQEARSRGAERAVITGGGEPGMLRPERLEKLIELSASVFGKVVLISNGYRWGRMDSTHRIDALRRLHAAGLSILAISRHHYSRDGNKRIMHLETQSEELSESWSMHRDELNGLEMRWICVLQRGGVDTVRELNRYIDWAAATEVGQVCFKELYVSASIESEYYQEHSNEWSYANQVPLRIVLEAAEQEGWQKAEPLPWGAPIFKVKRGDNEVKVAAYTEPSVCWERQNGLCRSWNLMSDGRCLASLEDRNSLVLPE